MGSGSSIESGDPINDAVVRNELKDFFLEEVIKWKKFEGSEDDLKTLVENHLQQKETIIRRRMSNVGSLLAKPNSNPSVLEEGSVIIDDQSNLVIRKLRSLKTKFSHTFLVAVDGSQAADVAFQSLVSMRKSGDSMVVYHSYSEETEGRRPPEARLEPIKVKYEAALVSHVPADNYYMCIDNLDDLSAVQKYMEASDAETDTFNVEVRQKALLKLLYLTEHQTTTMKHHSYFRDYIPDFLAFGFHGRKSELKGDSKQIMGSSADIVIRKMHQPCMLFKRLVNPDTRSYVMAVDSSMKCRLALYILQSLMLPRDRLIIVHVETSAIPSEDTKLFYEREVAKSCPPDSKYVSLPREEDKDITTALIEYTDNIDPDFLVLVPEDHKHFDKVTDTCLYTTKSNVLLLRSHL